MTITSESTAKIAEALAKAQGQFENPKRDREVTVRTTTGSSYSFKYATLGSVMDVIRKPLSSNGLCVTQPLTEQDGKHFILTRLLHSSGEWIQSETPLIVTQQSSQAFGSALTYMRRYALSALLGIVADEDDDGNSADGNEVSERAKRPHTNATRQNGETEHKPAAEHTEGHMTVAQKELIRMKFVNLGAQPEDERATCLAVSGDKHDSYGTDKPHSLAISLLGMLNSGKFVKATVTA